MQTCCTPRLIALVVIACLAACANAGRNGTHRNPELSPIAVDETTIPESAVVSIPMPEPEIQPAKKRADAASLWQSGSSGFFGDHRARRVGDILTINIVIDDEAELENTSERSRSSGNDVTADALAGLEDKLKSNSVVDLGSSSSSRGTGSIERSEKISLKVAAMIVKTLSNRNFVIAGRQEIRVNNELRELRVSGIIRPVDIEMTNSIPYDKIAEARISYGGVGQISRVQKPRYGEDVLDVILPY
jgi:flagellar L-ring protein precursor FlgH